VLYRFKQNKRHKIEGINDQEINVLIKQLKNLPVTFTNLRSKTILALLIFQGLRQAEIIMLNIEDIDFVNKTALIKSKGKDDKELINLHPRALKILQEYLKFSEKNTGPLFTSQSNNNKHGRLSTRTLRGIVKTMLNDLGINRTTHGFRHFFVTKLIKNYDGDLFDISRYTRHRNIEMLQIYNDNLQKQKSLVKYYQTFNGLIF
jgi:integrase/recombinase XerC